MVQDDVLPEEALLLANHSDVDDRPSLESANDGYERGIEEKSHGQRSSFSHFSWLRKRTSGRSRSPRVAALRRRLWSQPRRRWPVRLIIIFMQAIAILLAVVFLCCLLFPSYTNPPPRYKTLRDLALSSKTPGRANVRNERVFIAASLRDKNGRIAAGDWGRNILGLVDLLGPANVFLSIYENDPDDMSVQAMNALSGQVLASSSIVMEHLNLSQFDHIIDLNGQQQLKRIALLAEVRNRALLPLEDPASTAYHTKWDKLLYLNDIVFDPIDAANLLFSTNVNAVTGETDYRAACAVDFINPLKFYDTYATRDLEGYSIGVPFYPWFTGAGDGASRNDVLSQTDAVRVKSCWGGMVAFEAKWFQPLLDPSKKGTGTIETSADFTQLATLDDIFNVSLPLRFRAEPDTYWDASECCLIHADLTYRTGIADDETGIYMNPYIRVAYKTSVLKWLRFARRFERLYSPIQGLVNRIAGMPKYNPRRQEHPGDEYVEKVWRWDDDFVAAVEKGSVESLVEGPHGKYVKTPRVATPGQFCGRRRQSVIMDLEKTGKRYGAAKVPGYRI